jgi:hypothetical protein
MERKATARRGQGTRGWSGPVEVAVRSREKLGNEGEGWRDVSEDGKRAGKIGSPATDGDEGIAAGRDVVRRTISPPREFTTLPSPREA